MASPTSRSSTTLLLGVVVIVLIACGVYWMLDPATPPDDHDVATISAPDDEPKSGTTLPVDDGRAIPDDTAQTPEPLTAGEDAPPLPQPDDYPWEDPVIVKGHVEDSRQERIPEVEINLFDDMGGFFDSEFTNNRGEFTFYSDEALSSGWSVGTEPEFGDPDDPTLLAPAAYTHPYPAIPGKPPVHVKLIMGRPPRIEGRVTDAETGAPIDSADVEVVCLAPSWEGEYQDEFTDEAGYYSMNLVDVPPTDLMIRFADDDDRYEIVGPINLRLGEVRVIDVAITDPLSLEGYVFSTEDDTPISGVEITMLPAHDEFEEADAWSISDEEGEWYIEDIGTQAENAWLVVQDDDYGPVMMQVSDTSKRIEIGMGSPITVKGQLTDAVTGEPVTDGEVAFALQGPSGIRGDSVDMDFIADDGSFSLLLELCPPGSAIVFAECDGYVKFRAPLSTLAPVSLDLRDYEIAIAMTPLSED